MKIATYNIDWAKKGKFKIEEYLNQFDFDFLILTEAIDLNLKNFNYKYFSEEIPTHILYETQNYSKILNHEKGYRTIIYSKIPLSKKHQVIDDKTNIALEFETKMGAIIIYATIIGTLFRQKPFAEIELENCVNDCERIFKTNKKILIIGDFNTSFNKDEKQFGINSEITETLKKMIFNLELFNPTSNIKENIDQIIIPKLFENKLIETKLFIEKDILSDHVGICISLNP